MKKMVLISLLVTGGWIAGCGCDDSIRLNSASEAELGCPEGYEFWTKAEGSEQELFSDDGAARLTFKLPNSDVSNLQICLGRPQDYQYELRTMGDYDKVIEPQLAFYFPMTDLEVVIPELKELGPQFVEANVKKVLNASAKYFFANAVPGSKRQYSDIKWLKQAENELDSYWGVTRRAKQVGIYGFEIGHYE
ncbi:hypothetical protein [Mycoavidus sp. SF9855]|uniref:hypothetical protein n=1 Tax=Mycoavidus sp. SF9855 TaxID=2968475 RepID=UPI00211BA6C9|nr:hypothetical protein [Mycoavidus sp. SF9855]UUM22100.1 hypothetical protein NQD60_03160 [Mycoavidus sp. SF9855]